MNMENIHSETNKDSELQLVLKYVKNGWPKRLRKTIHKFEKINFQLSETKRLIMRGGQIYIPNTLRREVLKKLHEGHIGRVRMKMLAQSNVY